MPAVAERKPVKQKAMKQESAASRSLLMLTLDETFEAHFCVLPLQSSETSNSRQGLLKLDGSVSSKKIRELLRVEGWRAQRGSPCYVVVPSEDVMMLIEEFPSTDSNEVRIMAEGALQAMVELDQAEHVLLFHELHKTDRSTICALAVFVKSRLQRLFESVQRVGVTNPRFVIDIVGLWQVSRDVASDGFWGRIVKDETSSLAIVKGLKISGGVIRALRQRFYHREKIDNEWVGTLAGQLFPEDFHTETEQGMTWYVSHRSSESPAHIVEIARMAASGHLINFEPQPGFWKEHLRRQQIRQRWVMTGVSLAVAYVLFILTLGGVHLWQWFETGRLKTWKTEIGPEHVAAMNVKNALAEAQASREISGNALEVLRQISEARPDDVVLETFDYTFRDQIKLSGTALNRSLIQDFVGALKEHPHFKRAINDRTYQKGQETGWNITIPLKAETAK